jgi:hypothetical protein
MRIEPCNKSSLIRSDKIQALFVWTALVSCSEMQQKFENIDGKFNKKEW